MRFAGTPGATRTAAVVGLGVAADYALDLGPEHIEQRVIELGEHLRTGLAGIAGITVHDLGRRRGGIVTFAHNQRSAQEISERLRQQGINTSVSSPSSTPVDADRRDLPDLVRASVHYYNTEEELAGSLAAISSIVGSD